MPLPYQISSLTARPGQLILPKWRLLQRFVRQFRWIPTPGVRLRVTPNGTQAIVDRERLFPSSFAVALTGTTARISSGTVNGITPGIDGVRIDGLTNDGSAGPVPVLDLRPGSPGTSGQSWVGLQALSGNEVTVVHVAVPGEGEPMPPQFQPLALIEWQRGSPARVHQIVRHDLRYSGIAGGHFWAV